MSYEVLARKWRPRQFDEVVGQGHVTQTLRNALKSGRIAHAYLFVGPRGVGKTTLARIMAKALNCVKGPTAEPCDTCDICREIAEGRCLDVLEFDAASHTQVDRMREVILDNIAYAPAKARRKVFIIDEVHMLSASSFNALLKTLEEPPAHVQFIFATTEAQKIPATILSRCQRFDLRRIATRDIVSHLAKICAAEKVKIEEAALLAIGRGAEGGLRDAESALDQLIAFCGREIAESDVLSVFGLVAWKNLEDLAGAILKGDVPAMLNLVAELDAAGKDLQRLALELLDYARNLLVVSYAGALVGDADTPEAQLAVLKEQAGSVESGRLARIVDILLELQGQLRFALSRRTVLEVALVRAARAATVVTLEEVLALLGGTGVPPAAPPAPAAAPEPVSAPSARPAAGAARVVRERAPEPGIASAGTDLERVQRQWADIVARAGATAPLARGYLKDAQPHEVTGDKVVLRFEPEFADSRDKLDVPRNVRALQKALEDVLHRPVGVVFVVGPAAAGSASTSGGDETKPLAGSRRPRSELEKDPAVKRALEAFNGDIVDVRE